MAVNGRQGWWRAGLVLLAVWAVLAVAIAFVTLRVRHDLQNQIVGRDAAVLAPVVNYRLEEAARNAPEVFAYAREPFLVFAALETSELRGVVGVRLYGPQERLMEAVPSSFLDRGLSVSDWASIHEGESISRYHPRTNLREWFYDPLELESAREVALLEVALPLALEGGELLGAVQLLIDGASVKEEFARLDASLGRQAGGVFLAGALLVGAALSWAFWRLQRANGLLRERSAKLLEANRELTLAAKTSALGAVTAHLIHGLKNPLAGLREYVASEREGLADAGDRELAVEAAQRMQTMIQESLELLRGEPDDASTAASVEEVLERALRRLPVGTVRTVVAPQAANLTLDARAAGLTALVLENLAQNAQQAAAAVTLEAAVPEGALTFRVSDDGPGLPANLRENPFRPVKSSKPGGAGIGLAISQQLARHIGARLELERSGPDGTAFVLRVPVTSSVAPISS